MNDLNIFTWTSESWCNRIRSLETFFLNLELNQYYLACVICQYNLFAEDFQYPNIFITHLIMFVLCTRDTCVHLLANKMITPCLPGLRSFVEGHMTQYISIFLFYNIQSFYHMLFRLQIEMS